MGDINEKPKEDWLDLQKRVFSAEAYHSLGFLPTVKAGAGIAIIVGILLIILKLYVFRYSMWIYNLGIIITFMGILVFGLIYWMNSGTKMLKKDHDYTIQQRGITARCIYLKGDLPDRLSPRSGFCELYNKELTSYPYCLYCKSYITPKQVEAKRANTKVD